LGSVEPTLKKKKIKDDMKDIFEEMNS